MVKAVSDKPDPGRGLEVSAWWSYEGTEVCVLVVNQNPDTAYEAVVRFSYLTNHSKTYRAWQITNDTVLAAPLSGTTGIEYLGENSCGYDTLVHTFPPYSVTLLRMENSTSVPERAGKPRLFLSVSPVPSGDRINITYSISSSCHVKITTLDVAGRVVDVILDADGKLRKIRS